MTRSQKKAALVSALLISPVAPAVASKSEAQVVIHVQNVSDDDVARRTIRVERYLPQNCSSPRTLAETFLRKDASEQAREKPLRIAAGKPIGLTFSYLDDRLDKAGDRLMENRSCALSGQFRPVEGIKYKAVFSIMPGAASCAITLLDESSAPVEFVQRPLVCTAQLKSYKGTPDSGEGYVLKWNFRFKVKGIRNGP